MRGHSNVQGQRTFGITEKPGLVEGKLHLFVAIDRTTKFAFVQLQEKATTRVAGGFLHALIQAVPYGIPRPHRQRHPLHGSPQPRLRSVCHQTSYRGRRVLPARTFLYTCAERHRPPVDQAQASQRPVERMNRTIKDATVKRFHYEAHDQLRAHLTDFVDAYNFARRLKTLKGLTPYEAICKAWTKEPARFKFDPLQQMPGLNI